MARKVRSSSARRSSGRRSSRGRSSGSTWKKSKALAGLLVLGIVGIWIWTIAKNCGGQNRSATVIDSFPHAYMLEGTAGESNVFVVEAPSNKPKKVPFDDPKGSGKLCWEAWVCNNPNCPWLKSRRNTDKKPYVFPHVVEALKNPPKAPAEGEMPPMEMYDQIPECPYCKKYKIKDYYLVERYYTPEGKKMLEELRKKILAKRKKKK